MNETPETASSRTWSRPLRTLLGAAMVAMLVVVSSLLVGFDYLRSRSAELADTERAMHSFSERLVDRLNVISINAATPVELMSSLANAFLVPPPERMKDKIAILDVALSRSPELDGIYAGYPDGSFIHMVSLRDEGWRKALQAPDGAVSALRTIEIGDQGDRIARIIFLDASGDMLQERISPASTFDPRTRPWYRSALNAEAPKSIGPYQMATTGALGMTIAQAHDFNGRIVIGADVILDTITDFLAGERMTPDTAAFILDRSGRAIIHSDPSRRQLPDEGRGQAHSQRLTTNPLTAGLEDRPAVKGAGMLVDVGGRTFLRTVAPIDTGVLLAGKSIVVAAPLDELLADANRALLQGFAISAAVVSVAIVFSLLLAGWVTRSLLLLTASANRLQSLDFSTPIEVSSHVREISLLGHAMSKARDAIHNFALYVPKEFVRKGIEAGFFSGRSARRQDVTALFTDIYDFTTISENHSAEEVVTMLSDYFDVFGEIVTAHDGTIVQFLGDSVFAMWNAPVADDDHAANACRCALAVEARLAAFNEMQLARGLPAFRTRYGIHSGEAVVGSVGAVERLQYTAMGDTINVASRLEGMNKSFGTSIIASGAVVERCKGAIVFRPLGNAQAKGRSEPLAVFEVLGRADEAQSSSVIVEDSLDRALPDLEPRNSNARS